MTDAEHLALVLRTLAVDAACWRQFVSSYAAQYAGQALDVEQRLSALAQLWQARSPHALTVHFRYDRHCPLCQAERVSLAAARRQVNAPPLVYGECGACGAGVLLQGGAADALYSQAEYYARRDAGGAGYPAYAAEQAYREAKGARLLQWLQARAPRPLHTLLEIGSGFGFTRAAAERAGWQTAGVDLNPHAAALAQALYGQATFTGTLAAALRARAIASAAWDVVLYQFVLEHLADPLEELQHAAQAAAPRGLLALLVPNMQAAERRVFGASYRSFRHDHRWLFSAASLRWLLARAGWRVLACESEDNVQLLRGFFSAAELRQFEQAGRSADWLVLAERSEV